MRCKEGHAKMDELRIFTIFHGTIIGEMWITRRHPISPFAAAVDQSNHITQFSIFHRGIV